MKRQRQRLGTVGFVLLTIAFAGCLGAPSGLDVPMDPAEAEGPFSDTSVFPGVYDTTGTYARPLIEGVHGILAPEVVELTSALDGATIQMGIVRPDVPEGTRVPVVVDASPYYDPMTPERIADNPHRDTIQWWTYNHHEAFARNFVPHGYAVVFLATRGSGDSGGCWTMFGPEERADVDQALTWLGEQPWSNGNVGMIGLSWEASSQWMAASTGNPHLKTIVPVVTSGIDFYRDVFVRNGTKDPFGLLVFPLFYPYGMGLETPLNAAFSGPAAALQDPDPGDRSLAHRVEGAVCPEAWEGIAASAAVHAGAGRAPPGFFAERDFTAAVAGSYAGSILIANGLWDVQAMRATYPYAAALEAKGIPVKHLLGQWGHGYPDARIFAGDDATHKRWDWAEILLHWFDRWLKEDPTVDVGPGAQVQDNTGRWRSEATWPPPDAEALELRAAPGGLLTAHDAPGDDRAAVAGSCPDCARFETGPLAQDLRFAGMPTFHATATPEGPGGVLVARLLVAGPGGETQVGDAVMDLAFAEGSEEAATVVPGRAVVARMQFHPVDVHVPVGASLALVVEQRGPADAAPPLTRVWLHVGGDASVLTVHNFERAPDDPRFFTPPGVDA